MYEPAGSECGVYGDLRNSAEWRARESDSDLPLARGTAAGEEARNAPVGRRRGGGQADLVAIIAVVEPAVGLDVRPADGRSGTASTVD